MIEASRKLLYHCNPVGKDIWGDGVRLGLMPEPPLMADDAYKGGDVPWTKKL